MAMTERLAECRSMARSLMCKHGLVNQGWTFRYDNARARGGACFYHERRIHLSKRYVMSRATSIAEIENTILHEIAHAIAGRDAGHGKEWKAAALRIGCNAQRLLPRQFTDPRYTISCPCGHVRTYRHTLRKQLLERKCERCQGKLSASLYYPGFDSLRV